MVRVPSDLQGVLSEVRSRIARYRDSRINEEATKTSLIQPVLRALGWNVEDLDDAQPEYRRRSVDNPVDYALMVLREPRLFVEAKALNENLDDPRWANQFISYASAAGVKWIVLTNGDEYRIYNAYAEAPVERKIFRTVRISDESSLPAQTLELLAKGRIERNELEALWRAHYVDERVRASIDRLFSPDNDHWLVNAIRRLAPDLLPSDIRSSLKRIRLHLDLPAEPIPTPPAPRPVPPPTASPSEIVSLRDLIRAELIHPPLVLQKTYKGRELTARVELDGRVSFDGTSYNSLSISAGTARASIVGSPPGRKYIETNGWTFWQFQDDDGRLKPMDALRQRYAARRTAGS